MARGGDSGVGVAVHLLGAIGVILGGRRLPALDAVPCPTSRAVRQLQLVLENGVRRPGRAIEASHLDQNRRREASHQRRGVRSHPTGHVPLRYRTSPSGGARPSPAAPTAPGKPSSSTRGALAPHSGRAPARPGSLLRVEPAPTLHPAVAPPSSVEAVGGAAAPTIDDARRAG